MLDTDLLTPAQGIPARCARPAVRLPARSGRAGTIRRYSLVSRAPLLSTKRLRMRRAVVGYLSYGFLKLQPTLACRRRTRASRAASCGGRLCGSITFAGLQGLEGERSRTDAPKPPRESGTQIDAALPLTGRVRGGVRALRTIQRAMHSRSCCRSAPNDAQSALACAVAAHVILALYLPARTRRHRTRRLHPRRLSKCEGKRAALNPIARSTQPGGGDATPALLRKDRPSM